MTELSTTLAEPETFESSTQLDEGRPSEAPQAKEPVPEKPKPESRLDAIKRAADDVGKEDDAKAPKEEVKAAEHPKDEGEKTDVKEAPVKDETAAKEAQPPRRQPIEAPEKFMPRAKELWANTPHEVRADMQRVITEAQTEAEQARESVKEYEAVKPFAEMAKRSGTTIDQALGRYVQMEQSLRTDPAAGFRALAQNMNMNPVQMIGHILAGHNVSPQQLAYHIANNPDDYTALARQAPQQPQQQPDTKVQHLEQQIEWLKQQQKHSEIEATVIAPFAAENPRYHELKDTIAKFLGSDMVPTTLSLHDRLAAAYDMAVRISPSVKKTASPDQDEAEGNSDGRAGKDFGGTKSVRGAPATGVDTSSRRRGKMSRGDAISQAFAELGIAH